MFGVFGMHSAMFGVLQPLAFLPTRSAAAVLAHQARVAPLAQGHGPDLTLGPAAAWGLVTLIVLCLGLALFAISSVLCHAAASGGNQDPKRKVGPAGERGLGSSPAVGGRARLSAGPVTRRDTFGLTAFHGGQGDRPAPGAERAGAGRNAALVSRTGQAADAPKSPATAHGSKIPADLSADWLALIHAGGEPGHSDGNERVPRAFAGRPDIVCRLSFQRWCYQRGRLTEFMPVGQHQPPEGATTHERDATPR